MFYVGFVIALFGGRLAARALAKTRLGRWLYDALEDPWRPAREANRENDR